MTYPPPRSRAKAGVPARATSASAQDAVGLRASKVSTPAPNTPDAENNGAIAEYHDDHQTLPICESLLDANAHEVSDGPSDGPSDVHDESASSTNSPRMLRSLRGERGTRSRIFGSIS